jgi:hypothetical protein
VGYAFHLHQNVMDALRWAKANLSDACLIAFITATVVGVTCEILILAAGGVSAIIVFFMLGYAVMSWISFFSTGTTREGLPITVIDATGASMILVSTLLFLICVVSHSEIRRMWVKVVFTVLAFIALSATIFFILDDYTTKATEAAKAVVEAPKTVPQGYLSRLAPSDCTFQTDSGTDRIQCTIPSAERSASRPEG